METFTNLALAYECMGKGGEFALHVLNAANDR